MLRAERLDELLDVGLVAVVGQDRELRGASLEGAGGLVEAAREAVVRQGLREDSGDGLVDVQALGRGGAGGGAGRAGVGACGGGLGAGLGAGVGLGLVAGRGFFLREKRGRQEKESWG